MAGDVFTSYSADTHSKDAINPDIVRLMAEKYGIYIIKNGQRDKLISELPRADWVIAMGCAYSARLPRGGIVKTWDWKIRQGKMMQLILTS